MIVLTASELLQWGDLDASRRVRARGALGWLTSSWFVSVALSGLLAIEVVRRAYAAAPNIGPIGFSLLAISFAQLLVVFSTPYRMFWRSDSALLARLAIDGGTLYRLAGRRNLRAAVMALVPTVAAAAAIAATVSFDVALRVTLIGLASAALAALLAPAASLAGGAIVASDKAQAVIDSFAADVKPPGVAWLGTLPGLVAVAIGVLAIATREWVALSEPFASESLALVAGAFGVSIAAFAWAHRAAPRLLLDAQREVAALDQERLAHIERSSAGPLERGWAVFAVRDESARRVYDKDAALMRRRYPAPYFVAFMAIVATWIFSATSQAGVAVVLVASLAAYAIVMARRLAIEPVERARFLRTLSVEDGGATRAKRAAAILRALIWVGVPGASMPTFASDPMTAAVFPAAALVVAVVAGAALASERGARQ